HFRKLFRVSAWIKAPTATTCAHSAFFVQVGWKELKLRRCVFQSRMLGQRRREKSVNQGHWHGQARYFGILRSIQFTIRILLDQFPQQLSREDSLIFTARGKGKDDFGEGA